MKEHFVDSLQSAIHVKQGLRGQRHHEVWLRRNFPDMWEYDQPISDEPEVLGMASLVQPMILLGFGALISLAAFVGEWWVFRKQLQKVLDDTSSQQYEAIRHGIERALPLLLQQVTSQHINDHAFVTATAPKRDDTCISPHIIEI